MQELLKNKESNNEVPSKVPPWKAVDAALETIPSHLYSLLNYSWFYLIDLDHLTFSVNNWIHFELCDVPKS